MLSLAALPQPQPRQTPYWVTEPRLHLRIPTHLQTPAAAGLVSAASPCLCATELRQNRRYPPGPIVHSVYWKRYWRHRCKASFMRLCTNVKYPTPTIALACVARTRKGPCRVWRSFQIEPTSRFGSIAICSQRPHYTFTMPLQSWHREIYRPAQKGHCVLRRWSNSPLVWQDDSLLVLRSDLHKFISVAFTLKCTMEFGEKIALICRLRHSAYSMPNGSCHPYMKYLPFPLHRHADGPKYLIRQVPRRQTASHLAAFFGFLNSLINCRLI